MDLPPGFSAKVIRMLGDAGRAWLPTLPGRRARCRQRWGLRDSEPAPFLSFNYLEFAVDAAGRAVVLKLGVPHADTVTEISALRHWAGRGAVPCVDADAGLGALLLVRLRPGTMLWQWGDDDQQARAAAGCIRRLPGAVPPGHAFPHVTEQLCRADRDTRTVLDPQARWLPRDLLDAARRALDGLGAAHADALLHGDLHQENILWDGGPGGDEAGSAAGLWRAIDPKGVVGPAPLAVGRYLRNRLPEDAPPGSRRAALAQRLALFGAELGWAHADLAAAGLVDGVLGSCWSLEEEVAHRPDWEVDLDDLRWLEGCL